jgi:hypothetical protein
MDCAQPAAAFTLGQPAPGGGRLSLIPNSPLTSPAFLQTRLQSLLPGVDVFRSSSTRRSPLPRFCKRAYSPCNKTGAGNSRYGMGRVIEASRSSATDPGRSATRAKRTRTRLLRLHEHPLCPA